MIGIQEFVSEIISFLKLAIYGSASLESAYGGVPYAVKDPLERRQCGQGMYC
jgi:hypothetical protein